MATLASYTALVQNEVDDASSRAKNVIEQGIKDTYQEILRFTAQYLAGTTEEDVVGTVSQRYVTPTNTYQDLKKVLWKTSGGTTYYDLEPMREKDYYEKYVNSSAGNPQHYYMDVNNIYFDIAPSTAGTVKVSGIVVQNELTGSQVSVIPDRFTQVLLLGSIARFKAYEGLEDAREYFKQYRGPYFEQGKVGGALRVMIDSYATLKPKARPKLWGR